MTGSTAPSPPRILISRAGSVDLVPADVDRGRHPSILLFSDTRGLVGGRDHVLGPRQSIPTFADQRLVQVRGRTTHRRGQS